MYRITVLSNKPLSFYITKDGKETLVKDARRGQIVYTDLLTDVLRIYQEDRRVKITELRSKPAKEKKETTVVIPVKDLLDPSGEITPAEPAKKRRKQRAEKNTTEE